MEDTIQKVAACPNCTNASERWGTKNGFDIFRCVACRLLFVHPVPDPSHVYGAGYFMGAKGGFGYVDYDRDKIPMIPVFRKYLSLFEQYGAAGGSLLDIGAATGFFLKIAREGGYEVSGVEMSDYAAGRAREAGIEVATGDLLQLSLPAAGFGIVTMLDVLEHMPDPFKELAEARRILKQGGLLAVNTPNGESVLAKILGAKWHLVVPPEHLHYFSPRNLGGYLERNGFTVVYSGSVGKRFTFGYIFKTLYKWQGLGLWRKLSEFFSDPRRAAWSIPINLHDNFLLIAQKNDI